MGRRFLPILLSSPLGVRRTLRGEVEFHAVRGRKGYGILWDREGVERKEGRVVKWIEAQFLNGEREIHMRVEVDITEIVERGVKPEEVEINLMIANRKGTVVYLPPQYDRNVEKWEEEERKRGNANARGKRRGEIVGRYAIWQWMVGKAREEMRRIFVRAQRGEVIEKEINIPPHLFTALECKSREMTHMHYLYLFDETTGLFYFQAINNSRLSQREWKILLERVRAFTRLRMGNTVRILIPIRPPRKERRPPTPPAGTAPFPRGATAMVEREEGENKALENPRVGGEGQRPTPLPEGRASPSQGGRAPRGGKLKGDGGRKGSGVGERRGEGGMVRLPPRGKGQMVEGEGKGRGEMGRGPSRSRRHGKERSLERTPKEVGRKHERRKGRGRERDRKRRREKQKEKGGERELEIKLELKQGVRVGREGRRILVGREGEIPRGVEMGLSPPIAAPSIEKVTWEKRVKEVGIERGEAKIEVGKRREAMELEVEEREGPIAPLKEEERRHLVEGVLNIHAHRNP